MGRNQKRREERRQAKEMLGTSHQPVQVQQLPQMNQPLQVQQSVKQEQQPKPQPMQQPDPVSSEKSTKPQKKRITFDVSSELHRKAFMYSRRQGTTIKDLLTDFLERETINEKI